MASENGTSCSPGVVTNIVKSLGHSVSKMKPVANRVSESASMVAYMSKVPCMAVIPWEMVNNGNKVSDPYLADFSSTSHDSRVLFRGK